VYLCASYCRTQVWPRVANLSWQWVDERHSEIELYSDLANHTYSLYHTPFCGDPRRRRITQNVAMGAPRRSTPGMVGFAASKAFDFVAMQKALNDGGVCVVHGLMKNLRHTRMTWSYYWLYCGHALLSNVCYDRQARSNASAAHWQLRG
jgi:hypothetical protein